MAFHRAIVALVLISLVAITLASPTSNDLIIGQREYGDVYVERFIVDEKGSYTGRKSFSRTFPVNGKRITQVRFMDRNKKGNGATATIIAGGTNGYYITANFKFRKNHSALFYVEIYGKE